MLDSITLLNKKKRYIAIRINAIGSGLENEDMEDCVREVATAGLIDAIVLPKVECSGLIQDPTLQQP